MFGSRKYTPLPTNVNAQGGRKRAGASAISAYKKYAVIAVFVGLVFLIGSSGPVKDRVGLGGYTDSTALVDDEGKVSVLRSGNFTDLDNSSLYTRARYFF